MSESKKVGPMRTLHVEKVIDEDCRVVRYRLAVVHTITFPFDDPQAWCIPDDYVAAVLSDGLREFVNSQRGTDVVQRYVSKCAVRLKESSAKPSEDEPHKYQWYFDEDGIMRKYAEDEED